MKPAPFMKKKLYAGAGPFASWKGRLARSSMSAQCYPRTRPLCSRKGAKQLSGDIAIPEEEIKDPFVLEFLGLKDEYSENDLEEALIHQLENFLLELGGDFTFVGRQRRLRIGDEWYRVDLLFYHRRLHCFVIIDLKLGRALFRSRDIFLVYLRNQIVTEIVRNGLKRRKI